MASVCVYTHKYSMFIGLSLITYAARGRGWLSSRLYIYIAYYMQKGVEGVQKACKNAYVIYGRPLMEINIDNMENENVVLIHL